MNPSVVLLNVSACCATHTVRHKSNGDVFIIVFIYVVSYIF